MTQPEYQGRFVWQELLCSDITAATFFYSRVLSWKGQPYSPGSPYTMFTTPDGTPVAGAMRLSDEARAAGTGPHWRGYIGAEDVDAIAAQAAQLGARVLQPAQDVPSVGRVAMLADPEGAVFGLFRPLPTAASSRSGPRGFSWNELAARSRESALAFYQRLFGWELRPPMDMGGGFHYQTFGLGGQDFGGAYSIPAERAMPPAWCPYASSASADQAAERIVAAGGQIIHGPIDVPGGGRIVQFFDSQHAMFAVHSMGSGAVAQPRTADKAPTESAGKAAAKRPKKAAKKAAKKRPLRRRVAAKRKARVARRVRRKLVRKVRTVVRRKRALKSKLPGRARRAARRIKRVKRRVKRKVARRVRRKLVRRGKAARRPARKK